MLYVLAFLIGSAISAEALEAEAHVVPASNPEVQKIASYLVKRCEQRKAQEAPSLLVSNGGVLGARMALQEAEVMKQEVANLGGLHLPVEVATKEKGHVYYITMLVQYRTSSEMMFQLNPWPQWELSLAKVWARAGKLYTTNFVIPHRMTGLEVNSPLVSNIAEFALQAIRKASGAPCTWGDCMELAVIVSCESQKVDIKHLKKANQGRGLEKWAVESLTQVYYITFMTVQTSDLEKPAVTHLAAVEYNGDGASTVSAGTGKDASGQTVMRLVQHKTHFAGLSTIRGVAKMVGYDVRSFSQQQKPRFKQALAAVSGGSVKDVQISQVKPMGPDAVTFVWDFTVPGSGKDLEAKMKGMKFAGELAEELQLESLNALQLHVEGDMSSGVEGNELAPAVKHTGSGSSGAVFQTFLLTAVLTSAAWYVGLNHQAELTELLGVGGSSPQYTELGATSATSPTGIQGGTAAATVASSTSSGYQGAAEKQFDL